MSRLTDRLERDLREIATGAQPSPSAWESILARRRRRGRIGGRPRARSRRRPVEASDLAGGRRRGCGRDRRIDRRAHHIRRRPLALRGRPDDDVRLAAERLLDPASRRGGGHTGRADVARVSSSRLRRRGDDDSSTVFRGMHDGVPDATPHVRTRRTNRSRAARSVRRIDQTPGRPAWRLRCSSQPADGDRHRRTVGSGRRVPEPHRGDRRRRQEYLFTLSHDRGDARAVFDAFVATVDLTPETAIDFPGLTTTFVSPTYGYSFGYLDRGGLDTGHGALGSRRRAARRHRSSTTDSMPWRPAWAPTSWARRQRSRMGSRSMNGSTSTSRRAAAVCLAASKRRSPSTGSRAGSRSVRTRSRRPSSPAGGSISSCCARDRSDARAFFDAWVATIDLTPETAAVP